MTDERSDTGLMNVKCENMKKSEIGSTPGGAHCTVGNIGNFLLITKSRFYTNFGPKKLIF